MRTLLVATLLCVPGALLPNGEAAAQEAAADSQRPTDARRRFDERRAEYLRRREGEGGAGDRMFFLAQAVVDEDPSGPPGGSGDDPGGLEDGAPGGLPPGGGDAATEEEGADDTPLVQEDDAPLVQEDDDAGAAGDDAGAAGDDAGAAGGAADGAGAEGDATDAGGGAAPPPPGAQPAGAAQAGEGEAGAGAGAGAVVEDDDQIRFDPDPQRQGKTVSIYDGDIPMEDFLRFLSDFTGITVIADTANNALLAQPIKIVAPIQQANEEIIKAILEANKVRYSRKKLQDGTEIIMIEPLQQPGQQNREPDPIPVLDATVDIANLENPPGDDEIATMIFTLRYVPPADAIQALQALIGGATGGPAARGGPAAGRISSGFSMVEISDTQMLIITAKFGLLNYLRILLGLVDVPVAEPERIIEIRQIEWADATEIEQILSQFITGREGARRSRFGQRQATGPRSARAANQQTPQAAGRTDEDYSTRIIADMRTNQLIIETYTQQDYEDIMLLIDQLDVRFDLRRLRTHIYQVRYLKAVEVAQDLQLLISGQASGATGLGRTARAGRTAGRARLPTVSGRGATPQQQQQGGAPQNAEVPSLIVPHEPTNSLLIQAEPEEYDEIRNILSNIDIKRRQVFLEAALVQVQSNSNLNYAIELIAGNPDDRATRGLFASNFGLSGIDENFNRILPFPAEPGTLPSGGLAALMHRGDFPVLIRFFKQNQDSQILATPFILADDNEPNAIEILETRFVQNTTTQPNQTTLSNQQGEPAGITLSIEPTISGSQKAVFLVMDLSVSEFQEAQASANVLPPKNENTMTSSVTIPDGQTFVIGGLTRQNKSKSVNKVPILGDIPILGKLFRSESTVNSQNNLYVFLRAHILTDENFGDGADLTRQASDQMFQFDDTLVPVHFDAPDKPPVDGDAFEDSDRFFRVNDPDDREGERYDPFYEPDPDARRSEARRGQERAPRRRPADVPAAAGAPGAEERTPPSGWIGSSAQPGESGGAAAPPPSGEQRTERPGWFD